MKIHHPVRLAILDMNNNVENMGITSLKRIADRFPVIDYEVFDVRYKREIILISWIGYGNITRLMKKRNLCSSSVIHSR